MAGIKWTRQESGSYVSENVSQGTFEIRREPTTHGMNRASNSMWYAYFDGEKIYRRSTLAEAKASCDHYATRRF